MSEVKMGLGSSPDPVYLYVGESETEDGEIHPWHMYDHDAKKQIPVKERALTGILSEIRMKMGPEFKGKKPVKLQLRVDTGEQPYVIQSGVETTFTRGVLLALDMTEDLASPLMFVVANGGEKVVFGRVHKSNGERIKIMWDKERKIFPLVQKLQQRLGHRAQTWEDVQATGQYESRNGGGSDEEDRQPEQPPEQDSPF